MLFCCISAAASCVWICAASSFSSCLLSSGAFFRSPAPLLTLMIWLRLQALANNNVPIRKAALRRAVTDGRFLIFALRKERTQSGSMGALLHFHSPAELRIAARAIQHLPFQLPASRVDIVAARAPDHRLHAGIQQDFLERANRVFVRTLVLRAGERI